MKKNNLIHGLLGILPIFFFDKPTPSNGIYRDDNDSHDSGLTGVAKYLQKLNEEEALARLTGVDRYLAKIQQEEMTAKLAAQHQELEYQQAMLVEKSVAYEETIEVHMDTGVSRYLAEHPGASMSGVSKYIVKRSILSKETSLVTGVAKYINKQLFAPKQPIPAPTGVEKYLDKHAHDNQTTGVEKYLVKRDVYDRDTPTPTRVDKYLSKQVLRLPEPIAIETGVARYLNELQRLKNATAPETSVEKFLAQKLLSAQKAAARELVAKYLEQEALMLQQKQTELASQVDASDENITEELENGSAVERYMAKQNRQPKATGVDKYLAKQLMLDAQKAPLSGVERYMAKQALYQASNPEKFTGVARYMAQQAATEKTIVVATQPSSVAKYIAKAEQLHSEQPAATGVDKYVLRQEQTAKNTAVSGVDKYLAKQAALPKATDFAVTGVEKYLRHHG